MATKAERALAKIVDAWESLQGGNYQWFIVELWLQRDMKPAIDNARRVLGRPIPKGD